MSMSALGSDAGLRVAAVERVSDRLEDSARGEMPVCDAEFTRPVQDGPTRRISENDVEQSLLVRGRGGHSDIYA